MDWYYCWVSMGARVLASVVWMSFGVWGRWGRGGAVGVGLLSLVFRVLVCSGRGGYGAWWHGVVGLLRFSGWLVRLWARGRGCQ